MLPEVICTLSYLYNNQGREGELQRAALMKIKGPTERD